MHETCRVVAYIQSKRFVGDVRSVVVHVPYAVGSLMTMVPETRRVVSCHRTLSEAQGVALAEVRSMALASGHAMRVVDFGAMNRLLAWFRRRILRAYAFPVVVWRGPCFPARGRGESVPSRSSKQALG